jgi:aspartyl-tRNA(Asn)/glutamyl-tRNA(Gln) amidotransferase subunit A
MARVAREDAPVVAALRAAGMHCLGKLNMHPMALGASNHNPDFGDCFNPLRAGHSPGGSSGGSGAAVAAGLCALALGTDTMGSVRIPAAYCGVVGFKPSHGVLGLQGVVPLSRLLDHVGLLARRVEDLGAAMDWLAPTLPASANPGRPRLGVVRDVHALGAQAEVAEAYAQGLRQLAHAIDADWVDVALDAPLLGRARRAGLLLCEAELHGLLEPVLREQPERLPADLRAMMAYIEGRSAVDLGRALSLVGQMGEHWQHLTGEVDVLLLPTALQTAFAMDAPVPAHQADLTAPANMAGLPAISLPLPVPQGVLPVGLQMVGRRGQDRALLHLAERVEAALKP